MIYCMYKKYFSVLLRSDMISDGVDDGSAIVTIASTMTMEATTTTM